MSADNEMWQVLLSGDITDVDIETLKQWIVAGKVQKTDKVRKGGGSWVDVARTPALRAALSNISQQSKQSIPAIQLQDNSAALGVESSQYAASDQQHLSQEQPYLPQDQPYLDPNKNYNVTEPQVPAQATGTVFEGQAPPQKFLQTETLPEAFRKDTTKKPKRISLEEYASRMKSQQSMVGLIGAGFLGGGLGVMFWAFFALAVESKSYLICPGVGYLVGEMARRFGKCVETTFGAIAGFFAILASFLGQLLGVAIVNALQNDISKAQVFSKLDLSKAYSDMMVTFGAFNIIMYLAAGYVAYYFCFRTDTDMD
ncbi:MAG: Uncharacterized protein FD167_448 [bacterium]|nr:MAG: Uncharacterized protein FD167_448 [bacterium]